MEVFVAICWESHVLAVAFAYSYMPGIFCGLSRKVIPYVPSSFHPALEATDLILAGIVHVATRAFAFEGLK